MHYLLFTSLLWAFSFGLIKSQLAGVDATLVAAIRLGLALVVFLPFLRRKGLPPALIVRLLAIGALQFGLMYVLYIRSYQHLAAHQVALFTILTPLHVVLIEGVLARSLQARAVGAAGLAIASAALLSWNGLDDELWRGFLLVQAANLCFALGQVLYRRSRLDPALPQRCVFAWLYLGAFVLATAFALGEVDSAALELTRAQLLTLLYLGVLPSGLGFFLWNVGATKTTVGQLAAWNNAKIPLAVTVSLVFFGEATDRGGIVRLAASLLLFALALRVARAKHGAG